ncbi:hypothetical protein [Stieleria varia]|nr:hypothetical protein [Stieleria varia]
MNHSAEHPFATCCFGRNHATTLSGVVTVGFILAFALCVALSVKPVMAQEGVAGVEAVGDSIINFDAKLKGFQRGVLTVTREDGVDVMVMPPDDISTFQFIANAKMPFLQRGMMVRFSGSFGPTGAAITPIDKVQVFQPVPVAGMAHHTKDLFTPGVHPVDRNAPKKPVAVAKYNIVGNLMGINNAGVMMVQAGKTPLQVPLAQDVAFQIQFNNLNLAQEGDKVTVSGFYQPPDDTKVKADRVTITTDRIYGEPSDTKPVSRRKSRREPAADEKKEVAEASEKTNEKAGDTPAEEPAEKAAE